MKDTKEEKIESKFAPVATKIQAIFYEKHDTYWAETQAIIEVLESHRNKEITPEVFTKEQMWESFNSHPGISVTSTGDTEIFEEFLTELKERD